MVVVGPFISYYLFDKKIIHMANCQNTLCFPENYIFRALSRMKAESAPLLLPGMDYSTSQQTWIAKTQFWCGYYGFSFSEESQKYVLSKALYEKETHPIGPFRVLGPFSNSEQFSKDWGCPSNSPMNPSQKCTLYGKSP